MKNKIKSVYGGKKMRGFTLIELVVVMAIIAVLALLIIGAIVVARRTSIETTNRGNAKNIQTALEAYYAKNRSYPAFSNQSFSAVESSAEWATGNVSAPRLNTSCTGSVGTQNADKGGYVNSTSTTYTIYVGSWDCTAEMANDRIAIP